MTDKLIAVVGLGYVGLPLALEFGKKRKVIGFDIDEDRVSNLKDGIDSTLEATPDDFLNSHQAIFTSNVADISDCSIYIIAVPTPIDENKQPDLRALKKSTKTVAKILKNRDIVVYESTVYPGATEEICVPILEEYSNLVFNQDFYCGYSPERINPGDKINRLPNIKKITSGSTPKVANEIDKLYQEIITAGTHKASSMKVAEAAKVVENTQRDVNIALMNEFSLILNKLDIDTEAVLLAAESKWNFLPFRPGLVGGHCIHVDPYYLAYKAAKLGFTPEIILAGRRMNDGMGQYVANQVLKLMEGKKILLAKSNILVMGLTFKENCPDLRNTNVINLVNELKCFDCNVDIYDPCANKDDVMREFKVTLIDKPVEKKYDAVIMAVAHDEFKKMTIGQIKNFGKDNFILYDVKYIFNNDEVDGRL
jgi:UDP-N-acetyl-D-glucosamine/UDP-N-acetyl-D-galactosamine dehydrogenase